MIDPQSVINQTIPDVDPLDLRRLWSFQFQHSSELGVSYSVSAISQVCESQSADPVAVWARTTLLRILLQGGFLENWREHDGLHTTVFDTAAVFPLPNGLQGVDPSEFVATLPTLRHHG